MAMQKVFIYLLELTSFGGNATGVAIASDKDQALLMFGKSLDDKKVGNGSISCEKIGNASKGTEEGIICLSIQKD